MYYIMIENVDKIKIQLFGQIIHELELICNLFVRLNNQQYQSSLLNKTINQFPSQLTELVELYSNAFDVQHGIMHGVIQLKPGYSTEYDQSDQTIQLIQSKLHQYIQAVQQQLCPAAQYTDRALDTYAVSFPLSFDVDSATNVFKLVGEHKSVKWYHSEFTQRMGYELEQAESNKHNLLKHLISDLYNKFISQYSMLQHAIHCIAELDCLLSLSVTSQYQNNGVSTRPQFIKHIDNNNKSMMEIRDGAHPSLCGSSAFINDLRGNSRQLVPNDLVLGCADNPATFMLLTGANMGGMYQSSIIMKLVN